MELTTVQYINIYLNATQGAVAKQMPKLEDVLPAGSLQAMYNAHDKVNGFLVGIYYCMSKKFWAIWYSNLLYKKGSKLLGYTVYLSS